MSIYSSLNWLSWSQWQTYLVLGCIFLGIISGTWVGAVASRKGKNTQIWFLIGFLAPTVLGLIVAFVTKL
ncbi:MAG: hypothetical protein PHP64_08830 [Actinomycetota bacterium]|nr:hypothetical protein [Actinomycetota bacterium]